MPSQAEARSSPASSSSTSSRSATAACSARGYGQRIPAAMASVTTVARPNRTDSTMSADRDSARAQQQGRHMQQRIAEDAAQAGRQRPGADARQRRGRRRPPAAWPAIHTLRLRHFSTSGLCASSHQPSSVSAAAVPMLAKPSNCIARSEKMAPGKPSRLWIGFCVAWLSEGSCTDQVASAMAPSSASVISASPASSLRRRRRMSRKCSETKATTSRLRSAAGMSLHH